MREKWKELEEQPTYQISNYGRFRRFNHKTQQWYFPKVYHSTGPYGYIAIWKWVKGQKQQNTYLAIHKLVAKYWLPPAPGDNYRIIHLDGNYSNNHYSNLAWHQHITKNQDKEHQRTRIRWNPFKPKTVKILKQLKSKKYTYAQMRELIPCNLRQLHCLFNNKYLAADNTGYI